MAIAGRVVHHNGRDRSIQQDRTTITAHIDSGDWIDEEYPPGSVARLGQSSLCAAANI